jgi:hypothetical protein
VSGGRWELGTGRARAEGATGSGGWRMTRDGGGMGVEGKSDARHYTCARPHGAEVHRERRPSFKRSCALSAISHPTPLSD